MVSSAGASIFATCTAAAPPLANVYAFCAGSLRFTLQPVPFPWLASVVLALCVVYAVLAIGFMALLLLRWRRGDRTFFARESTPHGQVIVCVHGLASDADGQAAPFESRLRVLARLPAARATRQYVLLFAARLTRQSSACDSSLRRTAWALSQPT